MTWTERAEELRAVKVQKSHFSDQMEILLTSSTKVATSPHKIQNVVSPNTTADVVTLSQLSDVQNNQHVSMIVKVLQVDEKLEVEPKTLQTRCHPV